MEKLIVCGKGGIGKSFLVYLLAQTLANNGNRVLVVDCDETNYTLHKLFGFEEPPASLIDFLGGKKKVEQKFIDMAKKGFSIQMFSFLKMGI